MSLSPQRSEGRQVIVRLSVVPFELRRQVAEEIVRRSNGKLSPAEEARFELAASALMDDPILRVPEEKADMVLRERKLPPGLMPRVWTW